jgi:hypothetical protein
MTTGAFQSGVMLIRVDAFDSRPVTGRIGKIGMAPEAEFPGPVQGQFRRGGRVFEGRAMAVFALDDFMGRGKDLLLFVGMAVPAGFFSLIFNLEGLPFGYVPLPVPPIHVASFMDSEIFGHHESPRRQEGRRQSQNHIQGPQYMHELRPFRRTWN